MITDFVRLLYPRLCGACLNSLKNSEATICSFCRLHLPQTNYHREEDNPVAKIFWGRADIYSASSFFSFEKGGRVQNMIHRLKYKGDKEIGEFLGEWYGEKLSAAMLFKCCELILPVPLHKSKERKRGYNQSQVFAEGLSRTMHKPILSDNLQRIRATETQTKKTRFARWKNVNEIFHIHDPKAFEGRHVLLVDDVLTTGSTLEACAIKLLEIDGCRVSVATIAYAK